MIESFVKRCMTMLITESNSDKKAVTQLLSLFLDSFEGIRPLKQELMSYARLTNIKPV